MESLEQQWINPPEATCKTRGVSETTTQISFQEVSGAQRPPAHCACLGQPSASEMELAFERSRLGPATGGRRAALRWGFNNGSQRLRLWHCVTHFLCAPPAPPAGLWILLAASVGVAAVLVIVSQLALLSARRVARTVTFKRAQATLRRLQSVRTRRGASGSNGGTSAGCWIGRRRQGAPAGAADVAHGMGGMQRHSMSKQDLDGVPSYASGSRASEDAYMVQVLAAVQRVEHMLCASQQGQQPDTHAATPPPPSSLPYPASVPPV